MTATATIPVPINPLGGESYRLTLPSTANAARIARDFVGSLLRVSRHLSLVDDARLCVSEVVTNAHRHTRTSLIRVQVAVNRKRVTVSVADEEACAGNAFSALRAGPEQGGGRGLLLVESLALAWGTNTLDGCLPGHKAVWFTLGRPDPQP
ncbi:ATP-binding protein [Micrococcus luteus]|uniref:ATP-binding protein n=1 Tax=Micrococcus luteus TaxID=1270 RepID=UPI00341262E1